MALPEITINVQNGALGTVDFVNDGIAGMILSGDAAPSGLALNTATKIYSVAEAEALGIDADYDTDNTVHAFRNISEFYSEGGNGLPLWIMVVANTEEMTDICDKASDNKLAKKLLDDAGGEIRILGITRKPDAAYTPTYVKGLDDDAYNAIIKLQSLLADYESAAIPAVGIIEGRDFQGNAANLEDLRAASYNHVGITLASGENALVDDTHDKSASVGLVLGRLAKIPVMRKISRKKSGAILISQGYLSNGDKIEDFSGIADIHDKGYIAMRTFNGVTGYYFTSDPTATALTDDYAMIARRRVINKIVMLAYQTYIEEIDDEILVTDEGKIHPGLIKTWEGNIENNVKAQMLETSSKELSDFSAYIDPDQNVISTNKVVVKLRPTPVGYASNIEILVGFVNPALSQ